MGILAALLALSMLPPAGAAMRRCESSGAGLGQVLDASTCPDRQVYIMRTTMADGTHVIRWECRPFS